jgi:anti-sigma B factor antagonist
MELMQMVSDTCPCFKISGSLDASSAAKTKDMLRSRIDGGTHRFVIDLSEVDFLDSSGLSVLVTALKSARSAGGDIALRSPQREIRTLLEITRLYRVFDILENDEQAVKWAGA